MPVTGLFLFVSINSNLNRLMFKRQTSNPKSQFVDVCSKRGSIESIIDVDLCVWNVLVMCVSSVIQIQNKDV